MSTLRYGVKFICCVLAISAILFIPNRPASAFVIVSQSDLEPYVQFLRNACLVLIYKTLNPEACAWVEGLANVDIVLGQNTHQKITSDALAPLARNLRTNGAQTSFTAAALHQIMEANKEVDEAQTPDRHFDGEAFFRANQRLKGLNVMIKQSLLLDPESLYSPGFIVNRGRQVRKDFGELLHTLQDFYAHTNWAEQQIALGNQNNPNPLIWLGLPESKFSDPPGTLMCDENNLGSIDLTSGDYLGEVHWDPFHRHLTFFPDTLVADGTACDSRANKCAHGPNWLASDSPHSCGMNKDAAGRDNNSLAVQLARTHTALFANYFIDQINEAYTDNAALADASVCVFLGLAEEYDTACLRELNILKVDNLTGDPTTGGRVLVPKSPLARLDCGETCTGSLLIGRTVEIVASAKDGWEFKQWAVEGNDACPGSTEPTCQLTMDSDKNVKVIYQWDEGPTVGEITFLDANLEACVLSQASPDTPVSSVTSLNCEDRGISQLDGLEHFTSLTFLALTFNSIVDVSPLETLTSLVILKLSLNDIVDVGPLAALVNLQELWLAQNEILVGTVLSPLTNLYLLYLNGNKLSCDEIRAVRVMFPFAVTDAYWDDPDDGSPVSIYCLD